MNDRTVIGAVFLALLLGAGIFVFEREVGRRETASPDELKVFPGIERGNIRRIVLNSAGNRVVLEREAGDWRMTQPVRDAVDADQVATLVDTLVEMRLAARAIEARGGRVITLSEYGLATPSENVVVSYGEGERSRESTLLLGDPVAGTAVEGGLVHAAIDKQTDRVLIVADRIRKLVSSISRDRHVYRSRRLFDARSLAAYRTVELRARFDTEGDKWLSARLSRVGDAPFNWEVVGVDDALMAEAGKRGLQRIATARDRADTARVNRFVDRLAQMRVERFIEDPKPAPVSVLPMVASDDSAETLGKFALRDRDIALRIVLQQAEAVVNVGGNMMAVETPPLAELAVGTEAVPGRPDLVFARRTDPAGKWDGSVFAVRREILDAVPKSLRELRQAELLPENIDEIRGMRITRKDGSTVSLRYEKEGFVRKWIVEGPSQGDADSALIDELVQNIRGAKAVEYADWVGSKLAGIEHPVPDELTVELTGTLKAESKPGEAKAEGAPATVAIKFGRFPEKSKVPAGKDEPKKDDPKDPKKDDPKKDEPKDPKAEPKKDEPKPRLVEAVVIWTPTKRDGTDGTSRFVDAGKLEKLLLGKLEFRSRSVTVADAGNVVGMELARADGSKFEFENRGKDFNAEWWVKAPYTARADNEVSNWPSVFGRLDETRLLRAVSDDASDAARFGFDKSQFVLALLVKKPAPASPADKAKKKAEAPGVIERKEIRIAKALKPKPGAVGPQPPPVGEPKPEDFAWYLRVADSPIIYEIAQTTAAPLAGEVRDTRVPDFHQDEKAYEITVSGNAGAFTLLREFAPHSHVPDAPPPADKFKIKLGDAAPQNVQNLPEAEALFGAFSTFPADPKTLRLDRYLAHSVPDAGLAQYGLDKPEHRIVVTARRYGPEGKPTPDAPTKREWHVGRETEVAGVKVRAVRRVDPNGPVFVLKDADLKRFTRPAVDYLTPGATPPPMPKPPGGN